MAKKEFPDFLDSIERARENFRQNCDRVAKKEFSEFSDSVARACARGNKVKISKMIVRYYEGYRYKITSSPAGYSYRLKPLKKGSRWVNSKQTYATPEQAKNAALEEISRAVFSELLPKKNDCA